MNFCSNVLFSVFQAFETGSKMHLIHSLALLGVPLTRRPKLVRHIKKNSFIGYVPVEWF